MSKLSLKNVVGRSDISADIRAICKELDIEIWIEGENGKVLMGSPTEQSSSAFPISFGGETLGWVKGHEKGILIANLVSHLAAKEAEKKSLGAEVLNLYQEINVIFNFSEKLAETIEPDAIARVTLDQAMHSVPSGGGIVVLWNDDTGQLEIPALSGERLFNREKIRKNTSLLFKIAFSGQSEIINDFSVLREKGIIEEGVQSLMYAAMKVKHRIMGAIILAGRNADQFSAAHLKLTVTLALQSSSAIESAMLYERNIREVREREEAILRIHEVTKKFVPNEFIRSLGKDVITDVKLGDQVEKIVTVLFTDIRDFTTLSEKMTPEENFHFVSSFNARLGPIIKSHNGFINQYLGDSIMAIFPENPEDALRAAIQMQRAVYDLNVERITNGLSPIKAGIGMHTGPLIMGITGDESRMDAATISDTVNTASRIESLTKYYKSPLLISQDTRQHFNGQFHFRQLGRVRLKGKHKLLNIIECIDGFEQEQLEKRLSTLPNFNEAMSFYHEQQFENAIEIFKLILAKDPDDQTVKFLVETATHYLEQGVPEKEPGFS